MSVVDDVRDRLDIVEVVGEYVALKKSGRTHKALCPFHSEDTPSFVVFPETKTWRCFGACATGGDVYAFIMRIENVDFRGALEILARRAGIALEPPTAESEERTRVRARLREAAAAAAEWYHLRLMRAPDGEPGRDYLHARGFGTDAAREFQLGYAPDSWTALAAALRSDGFDDDELEAAGLVRRRDSGGVYDAFRDRVIFPIRDTRGREIGFGARTLDPEGVPKYLNSPQSPIFDKSRVLYGLDRAGPVIRTAGEAVIVEGYTDVIRAHMSGFENVVASLGTALTAHHIDLVKRFAPRLVLALDADAAGQAATVRGVETAQSGAEGELVPVPTVRGWIRYEHRLEVALSVVRLPEGRDPDDVIQADAEAWRALVAGAQPVMEYLFGALTTDLDLEDPQAKTEAAERLLPLIGTLPDPVAQTAWIGRLAEVLRIDERALAQRLRRPAARARARAASPGAPGAPERERPPRDRASWLLGHLLAKPRRLKELNQLLRADSLAPLGDDEFERAADRDLVTAIRYAAGGAAPPDAPPEHKLESLPYPLSEYATALRDRASCDPPTDEAECLASLREAVLRLRRSQRRRTLEGLRFVQAESSEEASADFDGQVERVRTELRMLDQLLAPLPGFEHGKLDSSVQE